MHREGTYVMEATMNRTVYMFDPEQMFPFARIPVEMVVPAYVEEELQAALWAYWCEHCADDDTGRKEAREAIQKRQGGWCSIADMQQAGYCEHGGKLVPEEVARRELTRILSTHCPC
jgi:hypothetical protein